MLNRFAAALFAAFMLMPLAASAQTQTLDPENTIYMDIPAGRVVIKLLPKVAPDRGADQEADPHGLL